MWELKCSLFFLANKLKIIIRILPLLAFLILPLAVDADSLEHSVTVGRGDRIAIDLLWPCKVASIDCDAASVAISKHPIEGVLFEVDKSAAVDYQHGGASIHPDFFSYVVSNVESAEKLTVDVTIEVLVPNAKVRILSPAQGATIQGSAVTIEYRITGDGHDHAHIQLNGEGHISVPQGPGSYRFTNLKPGLHRVTMSLANSKHKQLTGSGSMSSVDFILE